MTAPDLGSGSLGSEGSTPFARTIFNRSGFRHQNHCLNHTNSEQNNNKCRWCLFGAYSSSGKSSSDKSFSRVLDSNNQPIRGLWRRRKLFYARMSVTDATGRHTQRRVPLKAKTLIQAQAELEKLRQSRTLPPQRQTSPIWSNYWHSYISKIHQLKGPERSTRKNFTASIGPKPSANSISTSSESHIFSNTDRPN